MGMDQVPHAGLGDLQDGRDRRLIERIARAEEAAFGELFGRYGAAALGLARRIVSDRHLAEDVLQEVFLAIWRRPASYDRARGTVRSWLLMQVHHRAVDLVRREEAERRRAAPNPPPGSDEPMDDVVEERWLADRRQKVRAALASLPEEQRTVIELAYYRGLTQTQVASRLGSPLGTVKSRTLAAMKRLRGALGTGGDE